MTEAGPAQAGPFRYTLAMHPIQVIERGREDYQPCFDAMRAFTAARTPETPDQVWLVDWRETEVEVYRSPKIVERVRETLEWTPNQDQVTAS